VVSCERRNARVNDIRDIISKAGMCYQKISTTRFFAGGGKIRHPVDKNASYHENFMGYSAASLKSSVGAGFRRRRPRNGNFPYYELFHEIKGNVISKSHNGARPRAQIDT
jgi:hypothetical protein